MRVEHLLQYLFNRYKCMVRLFNIIYIYVIYTYILWLNISFMDYEISKCENEYT